MRLTCRQWIRLVLITILVAGIPIALGNGLAIALGQLIRSFITRQLPAARDQHQAVAENIAAVFTLYPKYTPPIDKAHKLQKFLLHRDLKRIDSIAAVPATYYFYDNANRSSMLYPDGLYYVRVLIGRPGKVYYLDIDMGTDVMWLHCDGPCRACGWIPDGLLDTHHDPGRVNCQHDLCQAMPKWRSYECEQFDNGNWTECYYDRESADGSLTTGTLMHDFITLLFSNSSRAPTEAITGCGYGQDSVTQAKEPTFTDGVMGLRNSKASLRSQLAQKGLVNDVMGQCLGISTGHLFFGDTLVPSSGMTWVPLLENRPKEGYYHARLRSVHYGADEVFRWHGERGRGPIAEVTFDCGTSFTYFVSEVFTPILSAVKAGAEKNELAESKAVDPNLPYCWGGANMFESIADARRFFKRITLTFEGNKTLDLVPDNYLIVSDEGTACLGILDSGGATLSVVNIIGDISMRGHLIVYDNVRNRIGWVEKNCQKLP